ncbi:hypothetical protein J8J07_22560, partial [Mycobacterium tuberculosis]|nr:hypothetical protein [Mycobacterium tuberculosis]
SIAKACLRHGQNMPRRAANWLRFVRISDQGKGMICRIAHGSDTLKTNRPELFCTVRAFSSAIGGGRVT